MAAQAKLIRVLPKMSSVDLEIENERCALRVVDWHSSLEPMAILLPRRRRVQSQLASKERFDRRCVQFFLLPAASVRGCPSDWPGRDCTGRRGVAIPPPVA